jgi:hypothetical protein
VKKTWQVIKALPFVRQSFDGESWKDALDQKKFMCSDDSIKNAMVAQILMRCQGDAFS